MVSRSLIFRGACAGRLQVGKVLEGGLHLRCQSVRAKMLSGERVDIEVAESAHVDAMYGSCTALKAQDGVHLGLFKGDLEVFASHPAHQHILSFSH